MRMATITHLRLPPGLLDEIGLAALEQELTRYGRCLADGLGLPDAQRLTLRVVPAAGPAAWICGHETQALQLPESAPPEALTALSSLALFRARELLWTPARARVVWRRQAAATIRAGDAGFVALLLSWLRATARQGLRAQRLLSALPESTTLPDAAAFESAFEQAAADAAPATLSLDLAPSQCDAWLADGSFAQAAQIFAGELYNELGLVCRFAPPKADPALDAAWFRLRLNDLELPLLRGLAQGQLLGEVAPDRLAVLGLPSLTDSLAGWGPAQAALQGAARRLSRQEAVALVDTSLVALILSRLTAWPRLVEQIEAIGGPRRIAPVLRRLVDEQVSVLDQRTILEAMLAPQIEVAESLRHIVFVPEGPTPLWRVAGAAGKRPVAAVAAALTCPYPDCARPVLAGRRFCQSCRRAIQPCPRCGQAMPSPDGLCGACGWPEAERGTAPDDIVATAAEVAQGVRMRLRRQCAVKWCDSPGKLQVLLLAPAMEQRLARTARKPLPPADAEAIRLAVREELQHHAPARTRQVLLTTIGARQPLRDLLRLEWPELPVVCYQELQPTLTVVPLARVEWPAEPERWPS